MFKRKKTLDLDSAWKLQNEEQTKNPIYLFINLQREGRLVDVCRKEGVAALEAVVRSELRSFLYNEGQGGVVTVTEFVRWRDKIGVRSH